MPLAAHDLDAGYHRAPPVLRGISLAVTPGRVLAIVGPNAAGKTTLLRCLLGVLAPRAGRVTLDGRALAEHPAHARARRIAYIPRQADVALGFGLREVVAMAAPRPDPAAIDAALRLVDLAPRAGARFEELSAGQQQRGAWARALVQLAPAGEADLSGRVLLADEPTSALDPRHALEALGWARDLAARGAGVALVMHDLAAARRVADDALVLDAAGRVHASGPAPRVLTPATLRAVFAVPFAELELPGGHGRVLAPLPEHADTMPSEAPA